MKSYHIMSAAVVAYLVFNITQVSVITLIFLSGLTGLAYIQDKLEERHRNKHKEQEEES